MPQNRKVEGATGVELLICGVMESYTKASALSKGPVPSLLQKPRKQERGQQVCHTVILQSTEH